MGPGMGNATGEKAKNFKIAIKRLFTELKCYRALITIAVILAILGAVLSIFAPNKLSELTDEISKGLVVNKDNLEKLANAVMTNQNGEEIEIDGVKISIEDQYKFITTMQSIGENPNVNELYSKIDEMPESIQKIVKPFMNIDKIKQIVLLLVILYLCKKQNINKNK